MDGDLTRRLIAADIEEGWELALRTTPLIFVNGVEFKGWSAPLALTRVVDQLSEKKLVAKTAEADHPMPPLERYVADWREVHPRTLAPAEHAWPLGPDDARLTIVIWGDYQQPQTALADEIIRAFVAEHSDAQYTFRAYPLDQSCNPAATLTEYPMACRAAQAALAAGLLGGAESYWKMHDWLLKNQTSFTDDTLRAAVGEMGLDAGEFFAKLDDSALHDAVLKEAQAGQQAGLQHSPLMFLNGKVIPRWMHGQQPLLRPILDAAARAAEK